MTSQKTLFGGSGMFSMHQKKQENPMDSLKKKDDEEESSGGGGERNQQSHEAHKAMKRNSPFN